MPEPLYLRIQGSLWKKIAEGALAVGDRVPSEHELARRFRTTRGTVRQALDRLAYEGLIERRPGLGTFVAKKTVEASLDTRLRSSFEEQIEAQGFRPGFRLLAFEPVTPPKAVAEMLATGEEPVYRLERLRYADDVLVGIEERFIPLEFGDQINPQALARRSVLELMDRTSASPIDQLIVTVRATLAGAAVARKLETRPGRALLVRDHRFVDRAGRVVLCGSSIYRGDRYQFSYNLHNRGAGPDQTP